MRVCACPPARSNITHRDLKLENLLLQRPAQPDEAPAVVIADFGLAKKMAEQSMQTICGTPQYVAPEVILVRAPLRPAALISLHARVMVHHGAPAARHLQPHLRICMGSKFCHGASLSLCSCFGDALQWFLEHCGVPDCCGAMPAPAQKGAGCL